MRNRERVIEILEKTGALKRGHFLLTSGRHSDRYIQCAQVLQYPQYTEEICKGLAEQFKDDNVEIVIGPATGGIIVAYEMARQLGALAMFAEKEKEKRILRRGFCIPKGFELHLDRLNKREIKEYISNIITKFTGQDVEISFVTENGPIISGDLNEQKDSMQEPEKGLPEMPDQVDPLRKLEEILPEEVFDMLEIKDG
jgi:phosphoribosylpyrophosphate synthetase